MKNSIIIRNPKAKYEYEFLKKYIAGIQLTGSEVKSLRLKGGSIKESFCKIENEEIFLINSYIHEYVFAKTYGHKERRKRKLLLQKIEIKKIDAQVQRKGLTIVPYKLFLNEKGLFKLEIYVAQGKKIYDKRESIKQKDQKRTTEISLKYR